MHNASCSACCGVHNLNLPLHQKEKLLKKNTQRFKNIKADQSENIVNYRKSREKVINHFKIKNDIYICPFVGYLDKNHTGCLIHPDANINPLMKRWEHPQNFSFYGEGICLVYDCPSKENQWYSDQLKDLNSFELSVVVGHSQIMDVLNRIERIRPSSITLELIKIYATWLLKNRIPITSFETSIKIPQHADIDYLINLLALFLDKNFYKDFIYQSVKSQNKRAKVLRSLIR